MERLPISFGSEEAVLVLVIFDMIVSAIPSGTISTILLEWNHFIRPNFLFIIAPRDAWSLRLITRHS